MCIEIYNNSNSCDNKVIVFNLNSADKICVTEANMNL